MYLDYICGVIFSTSSHG